MSRTFAAVLLSVILAACQTVGSGEVAGFGGTGRVETPFESAGQAVEVTLAVTLEIGTAELTVLDPAGAVRFTRRISPAAPLPPTTLQLPGPPGRWAAVLLYEDASGSRSVEWRAR
jgi:hypothetical protein